MASKSGFESFSPAPLGRRLAAGAVDGAVLFALCLAFSLIPLLSTGLVLPMWGVLAALVGYSVVPLSAFGATLGMRLLGLELIGKRGHAAGLSDLLSREFIGRGYFPAAYLFTLLANLVGSMLGTTQFIAPAGPSLLFGLVCLGMVGLALPGHLMALFRPDGRGLADLMAGTMVVPRRAVAPPEDEDEDERAERAQHRRRKILGVIAFQVVALVVVLGAPHLLTRRTESSETYAERITRDRLAHDFERAPGNEVLAEELVDALRRAGEREGAEAVLTRHLAALSEDVGCDKRKALRVGERMNRAGEFETAVAFVSGFTQRCGHWPRLLWVSLHAYGELGKWEQAARETTAVIEADPEDSDYWWWRGRAYANLKQYEQAAADYHQSMANRPNGFAASRYAEWAQQGLQRPCEAAFALQAWVEQHPDEAEDWVDAEVSRLFLAGNCGRLAGQGKTQARFAPGAPVARVKAVIQGKPVTLVARSPAPYTVVDRAFAESLGLKVDAAPTVRLRVAGEDVQARIVNLGEVRVGDATTVELPAAVVDRLPEGTQGLLGVNFLWRFSAGDDGESLALSPRGL